MVCHMFWVAFTSNDLLSFFFSSFSRANETFHVLQRFRVHRLKLYSWSHSLLNQMQLSILAEGLIHKSFISWTTHEDWIKEPSMGFVSSHNRGLQASLSLCSCTSSSVALLTINLHWSWCLMYFFLHLMVLFLSLDILQVRFEPYHNLWRRGGSLASFCSLF